MSFDLQREAEALALPFWRCLLRDKGLKGLWILSQA